jgi:uracil-DNA glycosylase
LIFDYLPKPWLQALSDDINTSDIQNLESFLEHEFSSHKLIFPPKSMIFQAFELCPPDSVKVVLIGQDPYHAPGQAHGLSFSVHDGVKFPPSLKNMFKELQSDLGVEAPFSGNLSRWAKQGVFLLNAVLTVESGKPGSHAQKGWELFTDAVIRYLSKNNSHLVFLLWGNYAFKKAELIDENKHLILKAAHPSPLARGAFFGCKHFSKTNEYLKSKGKNPIDWQL